MAKQDDGPLKTFLARERVSQAVIARGIKKSTAFVSLLCNEETQASQDTINDILEFLTELLGRPVTYQEAWGVPALAAIPEPVSAQGEE